MIRKQIYLEEKMNGKINQIAALKGLPQSEIIREGLELYLKTHEEKEQDWHELIDRMKLSDKKISRWSREEIYSARTERNSEHE